MVVYYISGAFKDYRDSNLGPKAKPGPTKSKIHFR